MTKEIYKAELPGLLEDGAMLIDVREVHEHELEDAIPGHAHVPLSTISQLAVDSQVLPRQRPLVFYCRSGLMSYQAAEIAAAWTDQPVYYLAGGLIGYADASEA